MNIRKDWTKIPTIVALLLCTWTLIMCIFVFLPPNGGWVSGLYDTLAVFIGVICIYEVLTGTIQKVIVAHFRGTSAVTASGGTGYKGGEYIVEEEIEVIDVEPMEE